MVPAVFGDLLRVVALIGAALTLSLLLEPWIEPDFAPLFLGAVALATRQWGLRAGIVGTTIAIPALLSLYVPPHYTLSFVSWGVGLRLLSFVSTAALIVWLVQKFRCAQRGLVASLEEVRTREERVRVALLKSPVVMFQQNADLRYIWVNNPFPEHTSASLLYKRDCDLFPPDEAEQLTQIKRSVLLTGVGAREDVTVTSRDGLRTMDLTIEPFKDPDGRVTGLLGTAVDITARRRQEEHLKFSREQFRSLATHLRSIHENQRALTSREIHDKVSQMLAALELQVAGIAHTLLEGADRSATHDRLREINEVLAATIETSERISTELRPSLLDNLGLAAAIESKLGEFQARTGIHVEAGPLDRTALAPESSTAVFRIAQEALTNVEHSGATSVTISLRRGFAGLVLQIRDNGRGNPTESMGLLGMKERARASGGKITVQPIPGEGTTLWIEIPIPAAGLEAAGTNATSTEEAANRFDPGQAIS
jgi:PAS domain S-box-containing protein